MGNIPLKVWTCLFFIPDLSHLVDLSKAWKDMFEKDLIFEQTSTVGRIGLWGSHGEHSYHPIRSYVVLCWPMLAVSPRSRGLGATSLVGKQLVAPRKHDWSKLDEYASYLHEQDSEKQASYSKVVLACICPMLFCMQSCDVVRAFKSWSLCPQGAAALRFLIVHDTSWYFICIGFCK